MFRSLLKVLTQQNVMTGVLEDADKMLEKAERIMRAALGALLEKQEPDFDIYALDRELNQAEIDIRRKILQHLSINPAGDIAPAVLVTSTIISIERIGDYAKNFYELSQRFPEPFEGTIYTDRARKCMAKVLGMIGETRTALANEDQEAARQIMQSHADLARSCEHTIDELLTDPDVSTRHAVLITLSARFLKRVSAHLSNLSSAVVNPVARIGFQPGVDPPEDADM